ncbi:hypothetical protein M758_UG205500 [Ceratodon purpureus]|nr:hypothetical protein M758_UG205500 [Ceratodon purpureus]
MHFSHILWRVVFICSMNTTALITTKTRSVRNPLIKLNDAYLQCSPIALCLRFVYHCDFLSGLWESGLALSASFSYLTTSKEHRHLLFSSGDCVRWIHCCR